MILNLEQVKKLIPHRSSMLFVDHIDTLEKR